MHGRLGSGEELFRFAQLEERVPKDHPPRAVRSLV